MPSIQEDLVQIRQQNLPPIQDSLSEIRQTGGVGGEYGKKEPPFDYVSFTHDVVGRGMVGGALDLTEAIVTLPTDSAALLGSKRAERISEDIRKLIPNLEPKSTFEDVVNTFTQYGIPATTAIKLVNGLTQGSRLSIRIAADLLGGGVADFVAGDPSESTAIPWGPTAKVEGEKPGVTRLKIGIEGAVIPGVVGAIAKPVAGFGRWVGTRIFPTDKMIERSLAATLYKQSIDPERAIRNIKEGMKKYADTDFKPTTGVISEDPSLLAYEKATGTQQRFAQTGAAMQERKGHNLNVLSDELEKVTKQYGGDPEKAREYFFAVFENMIEGKENPLKAAQLQLDNIKVDTQEMLHAEAKLADLQSPSSVILDDQITESLNSLTKQKSKLYRDIDPDRTTIIPKERLRKVWADVLRKQGVADATPAKIPGTLKTQMKQALAKGKTVKLSIIDPSGKTIQRTSPVKPLTYYDLENNIRPELSQAIKEARAANQGDVVERLVSLKKALEQESVYLELAGDEAGRRASLANSFYKNEYVPRFKKFVGDNYRKAIRRDRPIPATMVGQQFIYRRNGTVEATEQLQSILKKAANPTEANVAAREYLVGVFAQQLKGITNAKQATAVMDTFLNQRQVRETLQYYPTARKELNDFRTKIGTKLEKETKFGKLVASAQQDLKLTEKQINLHAAKWWVDSDPLKAIKRVLDSGDPERHMKQIVDVAKQDKSGSALKGMRSALDLLLERKTSEGGLRGAEEILNSAGKYEMKLAKVDHLLSYPPIRKAVSQLYSPQEMKTLDKMHEKLRLMHRIDLKLTANSPTAVLEESVRSGQVLAFSLFGIVKGRGIFMVSRKLQQILGRDPVELAWGLLRDSMLDPELAATLLMKASEQNMPKIKGQLATYMVNNLMTIEE